MDSKAAVISRVLRTRRYAAITILSGTCLGIIYYILTMQMFLAHLGSGALLPYHAAASVGLVIGTSALAGINFALMAHKMHTAKRTGAGALFGGVFAAFTPGCPACTAPLAVVLGAVGGLAVFPMQGLELKIISVCVLVFAIYWQARGLQRNSCCRIG